MPNQEFSVIGYCKSLSVLEDDDDVKNAKMAVEIVQRLFEDAYLSRATLWGMASAMENQLTYLGTNLLPNAERRLNRLSSNGILGEDYSDLSLYSNESKAHINSETAADDVLSAQLFIERCNEKMRTAAIAFVTFVRAHDEISTDLQQMTYGQIKASAAAKRRAA